LVLSEFFVDGCQNLTLRYAEWGERRRWGIYALLRKECWFV